MSFASIKVMIRNKDHCVNNQTTIADFFQQVGWDESQIEAFRCYDDETCVAVHCPFIELLGKTVHIICRAATIAIMHVSRIQQCPLSEPIKTIEDSQSVASAADTWSCTMSELACVEVEASKRPESIVAIFHFPEANPTFIMCHEDN